MRESFQLPTFYGNFGKFLAKFLTIVKSNVKRQDNACHVGIRSPLHPERIIHRESELYFSNYILLKK